MIGRHRNARALVAFVVLAYALSWVWLIPLAAAQALLAAPGTPAPGRTVPTATPLARVS
jgi:hypothetical protein